MDFEPRFSDEEGSDYSYYSDSDSESDDFYNGYSEKPVRRIANNFISLPRLRNEYNIGMEMEKKVLLFFNAVEEQDFPFLERLLFDDVNVDCIGKDGWTPLMKACLNGQQAVVRFLLNRGSNPNFQADLYTTLMACCTYNTTPEESKLGCVDLLLEHNVDVNLTDRHKTTALMHACSSGYLTIVNRLFLVENLIADAQDFDGWNAIFHAISNNRASVVEALINYGVDYKVQDNYGRTPLTLAEERCLSKIVDIFIELEENESVCLDEDEKEEEEEDEENGWKCNPYTRYLKELPNADGEGGFTSDTENILSAYGFSKIKNIPFQDFLNMNEEDLLAVGVKIKSQRKHLLLKVIHRYHRCPWIKTSMNSIMLGTPMGLEEGICILGSIAKHLTIVKAGLRYFKTRIENRQRRPDTTLQKDAIDACISIFQSNKVIQTKLKNILELGNKVNLLQLDDLIVVNREKETNKVRTTFKYGLIILGATTAGYFVFNFRLKIGCFINEFMFIRK